MLVEYSDSDSDSDKKVGLESKRKQKKERKSKRKLQKIGDDGEYIGPWGGSESEEEGDLVVSLQTSEGEEGEETQSEDPKTKSEDPKTQSEDPKTQTQDPKTQDPQTQSEDPQTQSEDPQTQDPQIQPIESPTPSRYYIPKKIIHTFPGHSGGVNKLLFTPFGLLSCGNDCTIQLHKHTSLHKPDLSQPITFSHHSLPVNDIATTNDDQFLSCSFDKTIILWQIGSGTMILSHKLPAIPTSLAVNPQDRSQFVIGLLDRTILHYQIINNSLQLLQTYDHHVGGITNVCALSDGFLSMSDDKSVRIWTWGVNIPTKTIAHPSQFAVSSAVPIPPLGRYIALQNMNDTIQVIDSNNKYKFKKKLFKNPFVTSHKVHITLSPDGRIIASGDGRGNALFWDWNSGNLVRKMKCGSKLVSTIAFNPWEQSKVAVAGADGKIYYCD